MVYLSLLSSRTTTERTHDMFHNTMRAILAATALLAGAGCSMASEEPPSVEDLVLYHEGFSARLTIPAGQPYAAGLIDALEDRDWAVVDIEELSERVVAYKCLADAAGNALLDTTCEYDRGHLHFTPADYTVSEQMDRTFAQIAELG